jgi:hypothetical protein
MKIKGRDHKGSRGLGQGNVENSAFGRNVS